MNINYMTKAWVDLDCVEPDSHPVSVNWTVNKNKITISSCGKQVVISRCQLIQLANETNNIVTDLKQ